MSLAAAAPGASTPPSLAGAGAGPVAAGEPRPDWVLGIDPALYPALGVALAIMVVGAIIIVLVLRPRGAGSAGRDGAAAREAEEMVRRLAADLDRRSERLERLIGEADAAARRLEQAQRAGVGGGVAARPSHATAPSPATSSAAAPWTHADDPDASAGLHRAVSDLAAQGLSPREIAQRLGQPVGQVELVLNLARLGAGR